MEALTPRRYVAMQLREINPRGDWNAMGIDRADELAQILTRNGINDLALLEVVRVKVTSQPAAEWETPEFSEAFAVSYQGKTFGYLGEPDAAYVEPVMQGLMIAWSAAGHGNVSYMIVPSTGGFIINPQWGSSSDTGVFREAFWQILPLVLFVVMPAAGFSIVNMVGQAVLGPTLAAAYPALATGIGQVAVSTVMNGGNVEAAVLSAAKGALGAQLGSVAGSATMAATNTQVIAAAAAAATSALVQGRDLKTAVIGSVIHSGAKSMDDYLNSFDVDTAVNEDVTDTAFNFSTEPDTAMTTNFFSTDPLSVGYGGDDSLFTDPSALTGSQYSYATPDLSVFNSPGLTVEHDSGALFPQTVVQSPIPKADQATAPFNPVSIVQTLTSAAVAAVNLKKAWNQVNTTARYVSPQGAVVVAGDNGLIQTQQSNGAISSKLPPINQPQSTISGGIVTNNGNGTYTLISPDGSSRTYDYPESVFSHGSVSLLPALKNVNPVWVMGGLGILAMLFMNRRVR